MKKFRVHGICFVPYEAQIVVEAENNMEAMDKAQEAWDENRRDMVVFGSEDIWAAHSWEPTVEEFTPEGKEG